MSVACGTAWGQDKHIRKGKKLFTEYKYAEAIEQFSRAATSEESEEATYYLATCYRQINNYREAEKWYSKLIMNENWAQAQDHFYYGQVLKQLGKYDQALKEFKIYADKRPADARANDMVASCEYAIKMRNEDATYNVERLSNINSDKDDYALTPYRNGYLFASSREGSVGEDKNDRSGQPFTDIYYVDKFGDKQFGVPKSLSEKINTVADEGPAAFDEQRKILYYTVATRVRTNPDLNSEGIYKLQIMRSQYVNGEWTKPIGMPFNSTRHNFAHPALSKDGQMLYFTSDKPGGYGGKDIYVSHWSEDEWSDPKNLGDVVNTRGDEMFPVFVSENSIFFSSDYHPGLGGLDMFQSTRKDKDSRFDKVNNLGKEINSAGDDLALVIDPGMKKGYIASNRVGGSGNDDIYYVYYREDNTDEKGPIDPGYVIISGKVLDKLVKIDKSNQRSEVVGSGVASAKVELQQSGRTVEQKSTSVDGSFSFEVKDENATTKTYTVKTSKDGYLQNTQNVTPDDIRAKRGSNLRIELERIEIEDANFNLDSYKLRPETVTKLEEVVKLMRTKPDMKLEVAGYCCPLSTDAYNYTLSQRRSEAIKAYFEQNAKDIDLNRVEFNWYGETNLLTTNPKQYELNRRTEFRVIHQGERFSSEDGFITVKVGDTLFRIAKNNGTTVDFLMKLNNLKSDRIQVGQKLKVR